MYYFKMCGLYSTGAFLLFISILIPFLSENTHFMISIILNLLKYILMARMWSILVNVLYETEKNL